MNSTSPTTNHGRGVRGVATAIAFLALSAMAGACEVEPAAAPPTYSDGYEPAYYDGNLVYYDDVGRPFYYVSGGVVWIAPSAAAYPTLTAHWRSRPYAYRAWYAHQGYRYRGHGYRSHQH